MTTIPHSPPTAAGGHQWLSRVLVPEMWAALAIMTMWIVVLVVAVYGPDIVTESVAGDHVVVPAAVALAPFAFFGTWVVARSGFGRRRSEDE